MYEEPVQDDVGDEPCRHCAHCAEGRTEIPEQGDAAGGKYLHRRKACQHENVGVGIVVDRAFGAECVNKIRIYAHKQRRDDRARRKQIKQRVAEPAFLRFGVDSAPRHGEHDRTAHSDARTHGVDESHQRICDVDRGKSVVADVVADEKAVDYGIKPRKRESDHGRQHESQKFLQHTTP